MGATSIILIFSFFGFSETSEQCQLKDGTYKVIYDQKEYRKSKMRFEIQDDVLTMVSKEGKMQYKIEWMNDDQFRLTPIRERITEPTEIEQKLSSLGTPFYILSNCEDNKIEFSHMRNMHIIISTGKLVLTK